MGKLQPIELQEGMVLSEGLNLPENEELEKGLVLTQKRISQIQNSKINFILTEENPGLRSLARKALQNKIGNLEHRVLQQGEFILLQGEMSSKIYLLLRGELEVIFTGDQFLPEDGNLEKTVQAVEMEGMTVANLSRPLTVIGEMGPLLFKRRTTSIRALKNTVLTIIPASGDELQNTLMHQPKLGLNIATGLAQRMGKGIESITAYKQLSKQCHEMLSHYPPRFTTIIEELIQRTENSSELGLIALKDILEDSPLYRKSYQFQNSVPFVPRNECKNQHMMDISGEDLFLKQYMQELSRGAFLCEAGDEANHIYVLHSGRMGVFEDDELLLQFKEPGDTLGAVHALSPQSMSQQNPKKRGHSLKALTTSRVMILSFNDLESIAKEHPRIIIHICKGLARRMICTNEEMTEALTNLDDSVMKLYGPHQSVLKEVHCALESCTTLKRHRQYLEKQIQALETIRNAIQDFKIKFDKLLSSVQSGSHLSM